MELLLFLVILVGILHLPIICVPKAPVTHTKLGYFIKVWIRSVHMCSCEASLAHEYCLTTRGLWAELLVGY